MIPARGVEGLALEAIEAGNLRVDRPVQLAYCADHGAGLQGFTTGQRQRPQPAGLVELGPDDLGIEADVALQVVLARAVALVVEDLGLLAVAVLPGVMRLEGIRGDVAAGPRIGVLAPGAADLARLLQDHEVVDTRLLQVVAETKTAKAGADDRDTPGGTAAGVAHGKDPELNCRMMDRVGPTVDDSVGQSIDNCGQPSAEPCPTPCRTRMSVAA